MNSTRPHRFHLAVISSCLLLPALPWSGAHAQSRATAIPQGGTVIAAEAETPDTLDPYLTLMQSAFDIDSSVFDSLIYVNDKGQFTDDLAAGYAHDASGLHWTFNLVHNATWQDGTPLTARDVVFTTNLVNNPKFPATITLGFDHVKTIRAVGAYQVKVTLKSKFAPFLLDWGSSLILPEHVLGKVAPEKLKTLTSFNRMPLGSGPFKVTEYVPDDHITETANPTYFRGAPHLDKIIFRIVPNNNSAINQMRTGEVNLLGQTSDISARQFNILKSVSGVTTYNTPGFNWPHVDLIETGFLRDRVVRQALSYTTPKQQIIRSVFLGYGSVGDADQPPGTPYYNPAIRNSYPFDPARARALLKSDGFSMGSNGVMQKGGVPFNLNLWTGTDAGDFKLMVEILKQEWGTIGVNVTIRLAQAAALFGPTGPLDDPDRLSSPAMNAVLYTWDDSAEPDDTIFWNSSQIPSRTVQAGGNYDGYSNPVVDQLTTQGVQVYDTGGRAAIYRKIQTTLVKDVPDVFLLWSRVLTAATSKLHGYDPQPYDSNLGWNAKDWYMTS